MKTGERGLALIKEFEGCKLAAYQCPAGIWTIGICSTHYGDGTPVTKGRTLPTEKAAIALLAATIGQYEKAVIQVEVGTQSFSCLIYVTTVEALACGVPMTSGDWMNRQG